MTALYPVVVDINGVFRGKRLPASATEKVFKGNLKLPASTLHVDIFGRDAIDSGLVLETGDRDGTVKPTERGPLPLTWVEDDVSGSGPRSVGFTVPSRPAAADVG